MEQSPNLSMAIILKSVQCVRCICCMLLFVLCVFVFWSNALEQSRRLIYRSLGVR